MQYTTLLSVLFATTAIAAPTAAQSKRDVTSVLDQLKGVVENKSKCDFVSTYSRQQSTIQPKKPLINIYNRMPQRPQALGQILRFSRRLLGQ